MSISICIPKINRNIKKQFIREIFDSHNLGKIKNVDLILLGKNKRAFIHYSSWYDNEKSLKVKKYLDEGKDFKLIYNSPWFWKCVKSQSN